MNAVSGTHGAMAVRTNIDIDDDLLAAAQAAAGTTTKKETVEAGLRLLVSIDKQREIRSLRGTVTWDDDLDRLRGRV
jgi:Arc/MetJ family transcription regulator